MARGKRQEASGKRRSAAKVQGLCGSVDDTEPRSVIRALSPSLSFEISLFRVLGALSFPLVATPNRGGEVDGRAGTYGALRNGRGGSERE
jgi:hypothetical protein